MFKKLATLLFQYRFIQIFRIWSRFSGCSDYCQGFVTIFGKLVATLGSEASFQEFGGHHGHWSKLATIWISPCLVRLLLGRPRECPGDTPGLCLGQSGYVPGTIPGLLLILRNGSPVCPRQSRGRRAASRVHVLSVYSEVAKKSVSARPGPILEGTLGSRMGRGRAGMAPTSGPAWVRNAVKQSTWRIWTGPLETRDGTWTGPGSDPGKGLDDTLRDSNRLLGLSDKLCAFFTPYVESRFPCLCQPFFGASQAASLE